MERKAFPYPIAHALALGLLPLAVACSEPSDSDSDSGETGASEPSAASDPSEPGAAKSPAEPAEPSGPADPAGSSTPADPGKCPSVTYGTVVFVGDSITSGAGQAPYYRKLLTGNDDAKYPTWKGFDLPTCWKLDPAANVVNVSKGGSVATVPANNDATNASVLLNQAKKIPSNLPGPVLVLGTIGGNDGQLALLNAATLKATLAESRSRFASGLGAALAELTRTDRFGSGVKANVYITNIYDPTGGTGTFRYVPTGAACSANVGKLPSNLPLASLYRDFNASMVTEANKYPGVKILDLFKTFTGHGIDETAADTWFVADCIHPNAKGHDAIRKLFWSALP